KLEAVKDETGAWLVRLDQIQDRSSSRMEVDQDQIQEAGLDLVQDHVVEGYRQQISQLQEKLEAATFRVGYLQAQLEASQETVKLLTDSQHKPGWWRRFCSWATGRSG